MKLPSAPPATLQFQNAPGSSVPEEFSMIARRDPSKVGEMAESVKELTDLQKEALCRQYVIIVDRSYSMTTHDEGGDRWGAARKAVENMVDVIYHYDVDHSVPFYLFDNEVVFVGELTDSSQVSGVFKDFSPRGSTGLGAALEEALGKYAGSHRPNYSVVPGTTFIVLLDGGADDKDHVKDVIRKYINPENGYVENHTQIAISFVQVGDDSGATHFLQDLDDNMKPLDVIDTKKDDIIYEDGGIHRILHDAIFD